MYWRMPPFASQGYGQMIAAIVGYQGRAEWDTYIPDRTPQKLKDISKLKSMGWSSQIDLKSGIHKTVD